MKRIDTSTDLEASAKIAGQLLNRVVLIKEERLWLTEQETTDLRKFTKELNISICLPEVKAS